MDIDIVGPLLSGVWGALAATWQWLVPLLLIGAVLNFPMLGRGPNSSKRDPWRGFKYGARATVLERAGGRCEGSVLLAWGRCPEAAVEVDHVFPYSKGGPTVVSNGQALCRDHNRRKGSMNPPWWYVRALEKRRRGYFPQGVDVRVFAVMNDAERAARELWSRKRR